MSIQQIVWLSGYTVSVVFTASRYISRQKAHKATNALLGLLNKIHEECSTFSKTHPGEISTVLHLIEPAKDDLLKKTNALLYNLPSQAEGALHTSISLPIGAVKTILCGSSKDGSITISLDHFGLSNALDQIRGEALVHIGTINEAASRSTVAAGVVASAITAVGILSSSSGSGDSGVEDSYGGKDEL
jgi:hypothetical protein